MQKPSLLLAALISMAGLAACDVEKTQEGKVDLPKYEVTKTQDGQVQVPKYDVNAPKVDVTRTQKQVTVPDVNVSTRKETVTVPKIEVTPAKDRDDDKTAGKR